MTQMRFLMVALLATVAWTGVASAAFYFDIWPASADGNMDTYSGSNPALGDVEGYAISAEGNYRFTKSNQHYTYVGFGPTGAQYTGYSDGPDKIQQGRQKGGVNDKNDGVLMADWLANKKAFASYFYIRNASTQTCDPYSGDGAYLNDPVTVIGFRVANSGPFLDRGTDANGNLLTGGHIGCCAGYISPLVDGGECAPPAWRMGRPDVTWSLDANGNPLKGYSTTGAIGAAGPGCVPEFYQVSTVDTVHPGATVSVGTLPDFGTTGFGGYSTNQKGLSGSGAFGFNWTLNVSDAMMINSAVINEASCINFAGESDVRDYTGLGFMTEGWFATKVDRCIINGLAGFDPECKGLVFSSRTSAVSPALNTSMFGRDQSSGEYGPYLALWATILGDMDNDGCVDVVDILTLVPTFGLMVGDAGYDPECDQDCNGGIDVVDLLIMVDTFGQCL
jgi:hypothetical protein